jgi:hypothetical protein
MRHRYMSGNAANPTVPPIAAAASPMAPAISTPVLATVPLDAPLPDDLDTLKRMIGELLDLLRFRDRELHGVRHRLDQLLRRLYGPKGEKFWSTRSHATQKEGAWSTPAAR